MIGIAATIIYDTLADGSIYGVKVLKNLFNRVIC
jgi:hypothetical protein